MASRPTETNRKSERTSNLVMRLFSILGIGALGGGAVMDASPARAEEMVNRPPIVEQMGGQEVALRYAVREVLQAMNIQDFGTRSSDLPDQNGFRGEYFIVSKEQAAPHTSLEVALAVLQSYNNVPITELPNAQLEVRAALDGSSVSTESALRVEQAETLAQVLEDLLPGQSKVLAFASFEGVKNVPALFVSRGENGAISVVSFSNWDEVPAGTATPGGMMGSEMFRGITIMTSDVSSESQDTRETDGIATTAGLLGAEVTSPGAVGEFVVISLAAEQGLTPVPVAAPPAETKRIPFGG